MPRPYKHFQKASVAGRNRAVNRHRNFLATVADKIEISGKFLMIFKIFGSIMTLMRGRSSWKEQTGNRSMTGPGASHGQTDDRAKATRRDPEVPCRSRKPGPGAGQGPR